MTCSGSAPKLYGFYLWLCSARLMEKLIIIISFCVIQNLTNKPMKTLHLCWCNCFPQIYIMWRLLIKSQILNVLCLDAKYLKISDMSLNSRNKCDACNTRQWLNGSQQWVSRHNICTLKLNAANLLQSFSWFISFIDKTECKVREGRTRSKVLLIRMKAAEDWSLSLYMWASWHLVIRFYTLLLFQLYS